MGTLSIMGKVAKPFALKTVSVAWIGFQSDLARVATFPLHALQAPRPQLATEIQLLKVF
jgi:hypothetical protein